MKNGQNGQKWVAEWTDFRAAHPSGDEEKWTGSSVDRKCVEWQSLAARKSNDSPEDIECAVWPESICFHQLPVDQ